MTEEQRYAAYRGLFRDTPPPLHWKDLSTEDREAWRAAWSRRYPHEREVDAYLETVERMEPDIHPVDLTGAAASIAISLKRIADSLEKLKREPV